MWSLAESSFKTAWEMDLGAFFPIPKAVARVFAWREGGASLPFLLFPPVSYTHLTLPTNREV